MPRLNQNPGNVGTAGRLRAAAVPGPEQSEDARRRGASAVLGRNSVDTTAPPFCDSLRLNLALRKCDSSQLGAYFRAVGRA